MSSALDVIAENFGFLDKREIERSLNAQGYSIVEYYAGEQLAFLALVSGPQFHFASAHSGKPLPRRIVRDFLNSLIDKHGFAQTKTPVGDFRQRRFNEAIGFKTIDEDDQYVTYRIRKCRL